MDAKLLPLTLIISLVLLAIPSCVCQNDMQYRLCSQPFRCGNIREIDYPFWGGNRPASCGIPDFKLNCQGDVLRLRIDSVSYRVLSIDYSMHTLKVARDDLWNNLCPRFLYNTTLKFPSFTFPLVPGDLPEMLPYKVFNCNMNQTNSCSFYLEPDNQATCNGTILVPVNRSALHLLTNLTATSTTLSRALEGGFSIQWWVDNDNCNLSKQSGGVCGYNQDSGSFSCYCTDRPHDLTCDGTRPGNGVCITTTGIVISSIIIFFIRKQHRLRKLDKESNQNINKFLLTHGSLAPKRYNYREIKKITKSFKEKLGQVGYGIVYKGELPDGQLVAVKVLTETDKNGEEFINEVASISGTSHVNIVNLLGFCYERKKRALVYEYMPNRSLDKFIYSSGSLSSDAYLEWEKLLLGRQISSSFSLNVEAENSAEGWETGYV
ncbi:Glycerophosphodiester phosphodiesterase [Handroanthus impetiginosus]|uniref:non-specific serine/threonine protein kinase n=1 Tax=Handroanthus impetiginosus TaxID=429701 RepID=A0A2G9GCE4_9LAMI|nr:Glycerophosphodiester phosphodiesterase [Handroanthus impetiginosus]